MVETLYQVHLPERPTATFAIVSQGDKVKRAAPIAHWTIGKNLEYVLNHYRSRGAEIIKLSSLEVKGHV